MKIMQRVGVVMVLVVSTAFLSMLVGVGCTTATRQQSGVGLGSMQLAELKRYEYQILDSVEGVGRTKTVFGITFPLLHRQWGWTVATSGTSVPLKFGGRLFGGGVGKLASARAMYDALSKAPNADAVFTMSKTLERRGIPWFHVDSATVKGKAVKVKSDEELEQKKLMGKKITITTDGDMDVEVEK